MYIYLRHLYQIIYKLTSYLYVAHTLRSKRISRAQYFQKSMIIEYTIDIDFVIRIEYIEHYTDLTTFSKTAFERCVTKMIEVNNPNIY